MDQPCLVLQRVLDQYQTCVLNEVSGSGTKNILKLVLIALKKDKLDGKKSTISMQDSQPCEIHDSKMTSLNISQVTQTVLNVALFHFDDEIRIKGSMQKLYRDPNAGGGQNMKPEH